MLVISRTLSFYCICYVSRHVSFVWIDRMVKLIILIGCETWGFGNIEISESYRCIPSLFKNDFLNTSWNYLSHYYIFRLQLVDNPPILWITDYPNRRALLEILKDDGLFLVCRSRTCNHRLPIEIGRWQNVNRENRSCTLCQSSELGEEYNYLFECTEFNHDIPMFIPQIL